MTFFSKWFQPKQISNENPMKKFLIVGLGNIGSDYENTRHNIGFKILEELAKQQQVSFNTDKLGDVAVFKFKGRTFILLKPSTYMNLSGKSVKYWMDKEKIPQENILVISDDLNIDFGTFRLKAKGSAGGHNGLKDINEKLGNQNYARFRFGISAMFGKGKQVNYVLGEWDKDEERYFPELLDKAAKLIISFGTAGIGNTMNQYNGKQVDDL
ncbi:PTH1 family peptidyl-tRNA hydrolase [Wenyingzhuangia heitensis]|uniref:Peptidyl-tRNA hydrolase n=1 Tax=Wenyingzhuangia heitensis TaxID=1487859 RepID=A0ABX0U7W5_9FLAO|nr:aminoacyl-tRNA hydrolase [Wenyingzhuangia heitensis]NIJ43716.1 PTH1 family peptidyl-tRNA hydrolase [Wenyingzhuangia heitensis]